MSPDRPRGAEGESGLSRAWRWLARVLLEPEYPEIAVEVRPRAIAAVRLAREGGRNTLGAAAVVDLPEGTLEASLTKPNILEPEAFRTALRTCLERAGALSGGGVSLVLPDPTVRVALVPGDGLKGRRAEAEETIRFRLHRALPFDIRSARLAWDGARGEQVLVAVALEEVVRGYEEALESLGFHPGLVEPSSLALASLEAPGPGDHLLVNWDDGYVSFLLRRGEQPLLVRTLPGEASAPGVARQATSTLQFYRERLNGGGLDEVVVRSAVCPGPEALAALGAALECEPRLLEPWAALGGTGDQAPAQGVAAAAASVLRRVA